MSSQSSVQASQYQLKLMTNSVLTTIQLFGFNIKSNEKEFKLQFNSNMFSRPNQKAFEVIVHFLLRQIDPDKAEKVFSQCWPIVLKEQNKEFKDVVFNWLLEITQKTTSKHEKQFPSHQLILQYQHLLSFIRFPIITKSLLMTPGGLKVCELFFALSQYTLIINLARLIENNKLNLRIPPKISPFCSSEPGKQPFSQAQTNNLNHSGLNSKIVSHKQLNDFRKLEKFMKSRLKLELDEFFQLVTKILDTRTKWQQSAQIKTNQIRALVDQKINLTQSLARKKATLAKQLNIQVNSDENTSLEILYSEFKSSKLTQFENLWLEFKKINDESFEKEFNKENINCLVEKDSNLSQKLQIDGQTFIDSIRQDQSLEHSNLALFEEKIHNFIYEHMDTNSTIRNAEVGCLFLQDGKQLDFINLVRLYNLVLISNAELISKIDREKLNIFAEFLKSLTLIEDNELISIDDCSKSSQLNEIFDTNKTVNEDSLKLKKQLDAILPKISESYRALIEREVVDTKIPDSTIKDEMTRKVKEFMKEYFNLRKTSIDSRILKILRQNRELAKNENCEKVSDTKNGSDQIDDKKIDHEYEEKNQKKKRSVKFCLDFDEKNDDAKEFHCSLEILDLK
ncbi:HAUS augmin-like complex subunit 6, partial [Brachionus plicatilis]